MRLLRATPRGPTAARPASRRIRRSCARGRLPAASPPPAGGGFPASGARRPERDLLSRPTSGSTMGAGAMCASVARNRSRPGRGTRRLRWPVRLRAGRRASSGALARGRGRALSCVWSPASRMSFPISQETAARSIGLSAHRSGSVGGSVHLTENARACARSRRSTKSLERGRLFRSGPPFAGGGRAPRGPAKSDGQKPGPIHPIVAAMGSLCESHSSGGNAIGRRPASAGGSLRCAGTRQSSPRSR